MDPFELLKADHRKVEELFTEWESASGKQKLQVFGQIRMELELHTHIEEKIFYPALEEPEETHDLALEAYEEHAVVKDLLKQLGKAKNADDEWEAQAKVLQENVEHHVEEEENELLAKAESALGEQELEELGDRMAAEKEKKQGSKPSKKSGASKSASKSASRSTAAKRTGGSKKSSKKSSKSSGSKSRSKKSGKKR